MSQCATDKLAQNIREYLASHNSPKPHTAQEYFTILLERAFRAFKAGNYGISAALVVLREGLEIIAIGQNTVVSEMDPLGHAEVNAIKKFRDFRNTGHPEPSPWMNAFSPDYYSYVFTRKADDQKRAESVLFTTLEPCPMCMVAVLNAGIQHVIIANPDEQGGALAPERMLRLPQIWPRLAFQKNLRVTFTHTGQRDDEFGISTDLKKLLFDVFWATQERPNSAVAKGVLFLGRSPRGGSSFGNP